jgi:hypothetical protein
MEIVTKFRSNFVMLTVCKGHPDFYSISQMIKRGENWAFIPFLRKSDDKDLYEVISQYQAWRVAGEPKREPL